MHFFRRRSIIRWVVVLVGIFILSIATIRLASQAVTPVEASDSLSDLLGDDYQAAYIIPIATPQSTAVPTAFPTATVVNPTGSIQPNEQILIDTPEPPAKPSRLVIEAIGIDAPVEEVGSRQIKIRDTVYEQWLVPDKLAAGWNPGSAYPGTLGNTVLFGHNNVHGKIFANLYRLVPGDEIILYSGERTYTYIVSVSMKLQEKDVSVAQMVENATWISPTSDERLTLVTCWPPYNNTHRLIVVARPETPQDSPDDR